MKTFATVTVTGLAGLGLLKLLTVLVFPVLGLFIGLLALTVKLGMVAAILFFIFAILRKRQDDHTPA